LGPYQSLASELHQLKKAGQSQQKSFDLQPFAGIMSSEAPSLGLSSAKFNPESEPQQPPKDYKSIIKSRHEKRRLAEQTKSQERASQAKAKQLKTSVARPGFPNEIKDVSDMSDVDD